MIAKRKTQTTVRPRAVRASSRNSRISPGSDESRTYRRFLPYHFLNLLGKTRISDIRLGDHVEENMTILFSDIRGFTALSESMTPRQNFDFINSYLKVMEPVLYRSGGFVDKYIGDAIMAIFPASADSALNAALGMLSRLRQLNILRRRAGDLELRIGIGLNTGLAMAGAVGGLHRMETTVISDAVNLASRIESLTKTYGVPLLIGEHVLYNLQDPAAHDIRFVDRVRIRGKEQPQSVYEVFDADSRATRMAKRRTKDIFEAALAHYHFREIPKARSLLGRCLAASPQDRMARVYLDRCARFTEDGLHEGTGEIGMPIAWDERYRIGHPLIDAQHRALFAQVNEFVRGVRGLKGGARVETLCEFLRKYIDEHFETEERSMREYGYPMLKLQQQQHARFSRDFLFLEAELREKLAKQKTFMLFKIQLLVVDWLANHTMRMDRHFGRFIRAA